MFDIAPEVVRAHFEVRGRVLLLFTATIVVKAGLDFRAPAHRLDSGAPALYSGWVIHEPYNEEAPCPTRHYHRATHRPRR